MMGSFLTWSFQGNKVYEDVAALARDGVKFIYNFSGAPLASSPHLYLSALAFAPEGSLLCRALREKFSCIAKVAVGHHKE